MSTTRVRLTRRGRWLVAVVTVVVLGAGAFVVTGRWDGPTAPAAVATSDATPDATGTRDAATPSPAPSPSAPAPGRIERRTVEAGTPMLGEDPGASVVAMAGALLASAPVVVVADAEVLTPARGVAWRLRAPLLPVDAPGLDDLLDDLGPDVLVRVRAREPGGASPTEEGASSPEPHPTKGAWEQVEVTVDGTRVDRTPLEEVLVPEPPVGGPAPQVLVRPDDPARPLLDTVALAADVDLVPVTGALVDDPDAVTRVRSADEPWVLAGTEQAWADVDPDVLAWDVEVARSGVELPGGGLRLFPGRRLIAMYGSPGAGSLGILGEQPVEAAVDRARALAAEYAPLVDETVVPTFEIITTVASGGAEPTGDYSRRVPHDLIEPWIDAAADAGIHVILDLQPGRTDFLTQAKEVEPLLRHPHVGLALDPEWRLGPDQVHLRQIGSVEVAEVQAVADWLAELTREAGLPQKLLLLHQFQLRMLPGIADLQVPPELAVAIQMDGQGSQPAKDETWRAITTIDPPADVWFGWKNFYDEDTTLRSPADTLAVEPPPVLVSYQ